MKVMKNYFFMIYLEGEGSPSVKHETLEAAEAEAKRLARKFKRKAYVLASIKSFEILEFNIEDCRPSEDLPL